jgi:hypothetical protein
MSRSHKKAIIKDRPRNHKKSSLYWRRVRSAIKNKIRSCDDLDKLEIPNPKTIVNDYDYCDYIIDYEHDKGPDYFWYNRFYTDEDKIRRWIKYRRK